MHGRRGAIPRTRGEHCKGFCGMNNGYRRTAVSMNVNAANGGPTVGLNRVLRKLHNRGVCQFVCAPPSYYSPFSFADCDAPFDLFHLIQKSLIERLFFSEKKKTPNRCPV